MINLAGDPNLLVLITALPGALCLATSFLEVFRYFLIQRWLSRVFMVVVWLSLAAIMFSLTFSAGQNSVLPPIYWVYILVGGWFTLVVFLTGYFLASFYEILRVTIRRNKMRGDLET